MAEQWHYITLRSQFKSGIGWYDGLQELVGDGYTFPNPDAALKVLGAEGWECISHHRNDGPRQPVVMGTLIQPPPWPVQYELVFKRRTE